MKARHGISASGAVIALLASLVTGSGVASAVPERPSGEVTVQSGPSVRGCGNGGFYGEVRFWYVYNGWVRYVGRVEYKIDKGDRAGGNEANIIWNDLPFQYGGTTNGMQDNVWRALPDPSIPGGYIGDYNRDSRNEMNVRFIFDQFLGGDPECVARWSM